MFIVLIEMNINNNKFYIRVKYNSLLTDQILSENFCPTKKNEF